MHAAPNPVMSLDNIEIIEKQYHVADKQRKFSVYRFLIEPFKASSAS
tara:strand:+ start:90039 stop:90179 length:141 start_codon:yes stop_codon:yes gene_type:complete